MASSNLKCVSLPAVAEHTATVIFLHASSLPEVLAYAHIHLEHRAGIRRFGPPLDIHGSVKDFQRDPRLHNVKFVLPHATSRTTAAGQDAPMPVWFDATEPDEADVLQTVADIESLITVEATSLSSSARVVLGGFSQGGSMSLITGIISERQLAGICVLSGRLPLPRAQLLSMIKAPIRTTPILWAHGTDDPVMTYSLCEDGMDFLVSEARVSKNSDEGLTHIRYDGLKHSILPEELDDLREWIVRRVGKEAMESAP